VGQLEEPGLSVLLRTGEGPFLIAEEFALDEIFRNGRKVVWWRRGPEGGGGTKGQFARADALWMEEASSSFPVPLSPVMRMV